MPDPTNPQPNPNLPVAQRIIRYPLDLTAISKDNYIEAEIRELPDNGRNRAVVLSCGAFYTESLVVYDHTTGDQLQKGIQYVAAQLCEPATNRSGHEACAVLIITDPAVSKFIRVNYQCVGGPYILNIDALLEMIETFKVDDRPVKWGEIIGKPLFFPPGHHLHDIGDVYGFEYLVLALEEIRKAILMGDQDAFDEIRDFIKLVENKSIQRDQDIIDMLNAHINDKNNPHRVTKDQVRLGLVENYPVATREEAEEGVRNDRYLTPLLVRQAIEKIAGDALSAHINDKNNPHNTTKAQVGLGNVDNFPTATQAEAIEGTRNDRFLTPLRMKEFIQNWANSNVVQYAHQLYTARNINGVAFNGTADIIFHDIYTAEQNSPGPMAFPQRTVRVFEATNSPDFGATKQCGFVVYGPNGTGSAQIAIGYGVGDGAPTQFRFRVNDSAGDVDNWGAWQTLALAQHTHQDIIDSFNGKYVKINANEDTSIRVAGGAAFVYVSGGWRQFWPPCWQ